MGHPGTRAGRGAMEMGGGKWAPRLLQSSGAILALFYELGAVFSQKELGYAHGPRVLFADGTLRRKYPGWRPDGEVAKPRRVDL